jgi:hypothetical protein
MHDFHVVFAAVLTVTFVLAFNGVVWWEACLRTRCRTGSRNARVVAAWQVVEQALQQVRRVCAESAAQLPLVVELPRRGSCVCCRSLALCLSARGGIPARVAAARGCLGSPRLACDGVVASDFVL